MKIPVIDLDKVLHIGTLDAADAGRNYPNSYEGHNLSVSLCPEAWQRIARLGGYPLHALSREKGTFVDVRALREASETRAAILEWARDRRLIEDRPLWRAWILDGEIEDWRSVLCSSSDAAMEEVDPEWKFLEPSEIPGPDGKAGIEPVTVPVALGALREMTGVATGATSDATDDAIVAWAMSEAPALLGRPVDGVWWRDAYEPESLSAPLGCIFRHRVPDWSASPAIWSEIDDEDELARMPDTVWEEVSESPSPMVG
jgi:hypothetical protein